jgi:hypothetical protein
MPKQFTTSFEQVPIVRGQTEIQHIRDCISVFYHSTSSQAHSTSQATQAVHQRLGRVVLKVVR